METTKVITPYFENGVFDGVRVTLGDEDFVIAPKDYRYDERLPYKLPYEKAMDILGVNNLTTWNYRQICLTMAYCDKIDEMLEKNGGYSLDNVYWTSAEYLDNYSYVFNGYDGRLYDNRKKNTFSVRAIKSLKK